MSWRTVVVTKTSKLDLSLGYMVVRDAESTSKIHISEISILIVESTSVSMTAALLSALVKDKIKVIFCDEKRNPSFEITPYYGSHDCSLKIKRQIAWDETVKKQIWTYIVAEKIKNQASVLRHYDSDKAAMLDKYIAELEFSDATNREGHAAKVYFNALFGMDFSRNSESPVNAALNFGYSLILSAFNREIVTSGYLTQLGLFHDNMFNQYNLSCDLMEPFRPIIDKYVKSAGITSFGKDEKQGLLNLLNAEFTIDGCKNTLLNTIKIYTKSVFSALDSDNASLICFFQDEL